MSSATTWCDLCELPGGQCPHTRPQVRRAPDLILVSPRGVAHLPDSCNHHPEDNDYRKWAEIRGLPLAWEQIKTGHPIQATGGGDPTLVATGCCGHCANAG